MSTTTEVISSASSQSSCFEEVHKINDKNFSRAIYSSKQMLNKPNYAIIVAKYYDI